MDKTLKQCSCCLEYKDISKFEWQKNRPNPRKICKKCRHTNRIRVYTEEQIEVRKKKRREYYNSYDRRLYFERWKYGVSRYDLDYSHCLICGSTERLHLDHDHSTGKFRGLLCISCNTGLGMFKDNIVLLENAIQYLNK